MQIGKMYLVKELFWFLYPTKEMAASVLACAVLETVGIEVALSESYKCNVFVVKPDTYVVLLEVTFINERFYKLLDSNGNIGWIRCHDFSRYFEFVKE